MKWRQLPFCDWIITPELGAFLNSLGDPPPMSVLQTMAEVLYAMEALGDAQA